MSWKITNESKTNDLRKHHCNLLTKHDRFSFNTADTPAYNTKTIDHSGMRIGTDNGVGVEHIIFFKNNTCEPLKIDLMNNTVAWRYNSEIVKGLLTPLEERKSLLIAVELNLFIPVLCVKVSCNIDLHRVINHKINLTQGVNFIWVTSELFH